MAFLPDLPLAAGPSFEATEVAGLFVAAGPPVGVDPESQPVSVRPSVARTAVQVRCNQTNWLNFRFIDQFSPRILLENELRMSVLLEIPRATIKLLIE
jgi:hypothetical protein